MKTKRRSLLVLVVLLGVLAWLVWPTTPPPKSPAQQAQERAQVCHAEAREWCGGRWCVLPRLSVQAQDPNALSAYRACLAGCEVNYERQCNKYGPRY